MKVLEEVLLALEHELSQIGMTRIFTNDFEDWMVRLPEMKSAIERTRDRFK